MLDSRILLKSLNDLEVRIMLCKSAFEWELLAKKYVDVESNIKNFFKKKKIPENFATALDSLRASLVQKKGELPPVDLSDFFK
ncbi:MAG TPA: hypothetical protein VLJ60_06570 [bacterium]|jgi:hypothetical protein|nr:hypothetical protein [bacterium]